MDKITQGTFTDYIMLFGDYRSSYTDRRVKEALGSGGRVYIGWLADKPAGYVAVFYSESDCSMLHAFTVPEKRQQGVFRKLLGHAIAELSSHKQLRINIYEEDENIEAVTKACNDLKFREGTANLVYGIYADTDFNNWLTFMEKKGNGIRDLLIRMGYQTWSFSESPPKYLDELYYSDENEYKNPLPVKDFFDNPAKKMDRDMSFLAVKDDKLAAYSLVSRPDKTSIVFEHISVAEKERGSGCVFLPFAMMMDKFPLSCHRIAYTMYENNVQANAFRKKIIDRVTARHKRYRNFIYEKG